MPAQAWTGTDANAGRVQTGVRETLRTANLRGKPAIIVAGRADTLIPVNMNARPYFGENKIVEGAASRLSYIEVTNAQHFDAFIDNSLLPGYDSMLVPLHVYFIRAMDAMWAQLTLQHSAPAVAGRAHGPARRRRPAQRRRSPRRTCRRSSPIPRPLTASRSRTIR